MCYGSVVIVYDLNLFRMEGGELFTRIQSRAESAFTERGICFVLSLLVCIS